MLRAAFEVSPSGSAGIFAPFRGRIVAEDGPTLVLDLPEDSWGSDVGLLVSGEGAGAWRPAPSPAAGW